MALETIFEFDKLRSLLRARAENLDRLGLRLTWEERRTQAWTALSTIMQEIRNFMPRVQWSPAVYDELPSPMPQSSSEKVLTRRDSVASISSFASDNSLSSTLPSRTGRFNLEQALAKDAARFTARINALGTTIVNADKALRKLIDKTTVPDSILDEQDLLELKGQHEVESVGRFLMSLAAQWKKLVISPFCI
jgi:hypothetical protein